MERQMVRSLPLIPEFDEQKVEEWLKRSEEKAVESDWNPERWVGFVANKLRWKALEAYSKMSVEDMEVYEEIKADIPRNL